MSMPGLDMEHRPSAVAPSRFIQTGLLFLNGATALILLQIPTVMAQPRHNPVSLVLAHFMLLGFGTLITFGALGQMIPVIIGESIKADRSSRLALIILAPSVLLQAMGFAVWTPWMVAIGGTGVFIGTLMFCIPYLGPLMRRSRDDVTARFMIASLIYVMLTEIIGLALAAQLHTVWSVTLFWQGLPIHMLLGGLGWFTGIIIGVSYKLFPMFTTSGSLPDQHAKRIFVGFNSGLLLSIGSSLMSSLVGLVVGLGIVAVSIVFYFLDMRHIIKKRLRRTLGSGMTQSATSLIYLIISGLIMAGLLVHFAGYGPTISTIAVQRIIVAASLLFIFGWIGNMILGMLSKIVPMLVWLDVYSEQVGDIATPTLGEMIDENALRMGNGGYQVGLALLSIGIACGGTAVATLGAAILMFGALYLTITLMRVWFRSM